MNKGLADKKEFRLGLFSMLIFLLLMMSGCQPKGEKSPLNPDEPVSVTLWHYYSGHNKEKFDELVSEFNHSAGMEKGIVVDAQSLGDVEQLKTAILDAANRKIGSKPLPDIFAAYPETAFQVHQLAGLVDIETYFTEEEIQQYKQDFLYDGSFGEDNKLRIVPVAKSTEILYLNRTFWDRFAADNDVSLDDLSTWEGVVSTAEKYYEWSNGKAFLGIDSNSNFMLISAMQLGEELYDYDDVVRLRFRQEVAKKIWDTFYVPYIQGYFVKTGRFSSDDAKLGTTIAYTGSTAGASYFPTEVTLSEDAVYPIVSATLPYPHFEKGMPYVVQQGAGMAITKSDLAHEYAAAQFLKWFTNSDQNLEFAVSTAYLPVTIDALNEDLILDVVANQDSTKSDTITSSIKTTLHLFDQYKFYAYKPFAGSTEMRQLLENHLFNRVCNDLDVLAGYSDENEKAAKFEQFASEENFNTWYADFATDAETILTTAMHN